MGKCFIECEHVLAEFWLGDGYNFIAGLPVFACQRMSFCSADVLETANAMQPHVMRAIYIFNAVIFYIFKNCCEVHGI